MFPIGHAFGFRLFVRVEFKIFAAQNGGLARLCGIRCGKQSVLSFFAAFAFVLRLCGFGGLFGKLSLTGFFRS